MDSGKDERKDVFEKYIHKLMSITDKLNRLSLVIFSIFLIALLLIIFIFYLRVNYSLSLTNSRLDLTPFTFVGFFFPIYGIILLFWFSQQVKKGMTYYEEITDEFEWGNIEEKRRAPFEIRIVTKEYLKSTDLPLAKGNLGISLYFILFVALIIVHAYLSF